MKLLDTNVCIAVLNGSPEVVVARLRSHQPGELRLCSVVKAELLYGARRSARAPQNLRHLADFFAAFVSLPFDDACAERYAVIREELVRGGRSIGPQDLLIAATALRHDLELVTHSVAEFSRVAGLRLVDWEA